jgi:hypothetical protein
MKNQGVPEPQAALDTIQILENGDPLVDLRSIAGLPLGKCLYMLSGRILALFLGRFGMGGSNGRKNLSVWNHLD